MDKFGWDAAAFIVSAGMFLVVRYTTEPVDHTSKVTIAFVTGMVTAAMILKVMP